jgi:hypothetical protein
LEKVTSGGRIDHRSFDRAMRSANFGRRVAYDRPLATPIRVWRAAVVLLVLGSLLVLFLPSASRFRSSLHDQVEAVLHSADVSVSLATAATRPSQVPPIGFVPTGIASGKMQTPWAVRWSSAVHGPNPARTCRLTSTGASGYLLIGFGRPSSIDGVTIRAGIDHSDPKWAQLDRPALVDLLFSDGTCIGLHLADQFTPQHFGLHLRNVTSVTIVVASTYPAETVGMGVTAVSSVTFVHRRPSH